MDAAQSVNLIEAVVEIPCLIETEHLELARAQPSERGTSMRAMKREEMGRRLEQRGME